MQIPTPINVPPRALRRVFFSLLGFFFGTLCALAQMEAGSLAGKVTKAGAPLSGAIAGISSLFLETSTHRDGGFYLRFVPVGTRPVEISYLGLPGKTVSVTVTNGQRAALDANLGVTTSETGAEVINIKAFQAAGAGGPSPALFFGETLLIRNPAAVKS